METALRLMKAGAALSDVARRSLDRRSTAAIRLWREALATLHIEDRLIWASIPLALRRAARYEGNGDAGLVSFLSSAEDADIAAVFIEREDGRIEISFRAAPGYDVSQIAFQLGGGGHTLASGCTIPGPLEAARARVLAALRNVLPDSRRSEP
jgi:phosphoesterase RecJ-like protein